MPINYEVNTATFTDICEIEEAEGLLDWILESPEGVLDLKEVHHFHTAILQVCMALKPKIAEWPTDIDLKNFLRSVLL